MTDENMVPLKVSDTRQNVHTYEIDWQPDTTTWSIDGQVMRTLKKSDTWNETSKTYNYPQTPSRVQLSLWPAGLPSNGEGTIEWAGGLVDWDSSYMQNGYYYAMVSDVTVECYNPPSGAGSGDAYYYTSIAGTEGDVKIGNNNTILGSFLATGENPTYDPNAKPSGTQSTAAASPTAQVETVPGISGGGNVASSGRAPVDTDGDNSGTADAGDGNTSQTSGQGGSAFSQGTPSDGSNTSEAPKLAAGSVVALLGFFVAALTL
jgi:beta-glucanase (GH16 family)